MVIRLIRAGHTPEQAEVWAGRIPEWQAADPQAVNAFSVGIAALSRERQRYQPTAEHLGPLAGAAEHWASYRSGERPRAGGASSVRRRGDGCRWPAGSPHPVSTARFRSVTVRVKRVST